MTAKAMPGNDPDRALQPAPDEGLPGMRTFIVLRVGDALYALSAEDVESVAALPDIVPVPTAMDCFLGIAHVGGRIVPVVDLARLFEPSAPVGVAGLAASERGHGAAGASPRIAILRVDGRVFGVPSSGMLGLKEVAAEAIHAGDGTDAPFVAGRFEVAEGLVTWLRLSAILEHLIDRAARGAGGRSS